MTRDHPLFPYLVAAVAIASFSLMDALMKQASIMVGAYNALFYRSLVGTALILPVWRIAGGRRPAPAVLRIHLLRGAVSAAMALLFFYSLVRLPIAEAIAISFIAPLLALYLAAAMLGERIGRKAVFASLLGFAGVLVIAGGRLERGAFGPEAASGIAAILVSAGLYAWNLILQRRIAQLADPREIALAQNAVVALILALFAPWFAVWPHPASFQPIALAAGLATGSLMLLAWAYARAEAHILVPVEYTGFLWAALFGWLFFAEQVQPATLCGAALIVIGCWIAAPRRHTEQTAT